MRKFSIRNSRNQVVKLNNEEGIFLANPSGMGFTMDRNYNELSDGFFASSKDTQQQGSFQCDLYFIGDNPYAAYQNFVNWLLSDERTVMAYSPYNGSTYYCEVDVEYINKTEIDRTGVLVCPSSFHCVTPWYKPNKLEFIIDPLETGVARFDLSNFDDDDARFTPMATLAYSGMIPNSGHLPASIVFTFTGSVANPVLTLIGANTGKVYGACVINTELSEGDILEYSSDKADNHVRKISDGVVTDLQDSVVPGTELYFSVPNTEPCELLFDGSTTPSGTAKAEIRYYYRSV